MKSTPWQFDGLRDGKAVLSRKVSGSNYYGDGMTMYSDTDGGDLGYMLRNKARFGAAANAAITALVAAAQSA